MSTAEVFWGLSSCRVYKKRLITWSLGLGVRFRFLMLANSFFLLEPVWNCHRIWSDFYPSQRYWQILFVWNVLFVSSSSIHGAIQHTPCFSMFTGQSWPQILATSNDAFKSLAVTKRSLIVWSSLVLLHNSKMLLLTRVQVCSWTPGSN